MDEMLSIALWIMIIFMTVSAAVVWFGGQSGISDYHLGLDGYQNNHLNVDANKYTTTQCEMTSLFDAPTYAWCFIGKITTPIFDVVSYTWDLLTAWTQLLHAILVSVPAGDLFESIFNPLLTIVEIGAVLVILMRLAAIVRGTGAIGL